MIADENKQNIIEGPGFAAFIDLHDSTYAWDQSSATAVEMIGELYKLVEKAADKFEGHIGNFTGDGFLFLFKNVENCILCLSRIIEEWVAVREKYVERYCEKGILAPDDKFLSLRTGVSFGNFGSLKMRDKIHYAGSGINKAQRCEAASKDFFKRVKIGELESPNYVFIDSSAENLILARTDFYISGQLDAHFKGYCQSSMSAEKTEFESKKQFIYAVWPKKKAGLSGKSAKEMEKLALAQSKSDIGDRLLIAAQSAKSGTMLHELSESATGKNRKKLLEETIKVYREALQIYTLESFPGDYARLQSELGKALCDQSELLSGANKNQNLELAIAAQREALKIYTIEASPEDYANVQINIGSILRNQFGLFGDKVNQEKIDEAINIYKKTLRVIAFETSPKLWALAQNNLGNVLRIHAKFSSGKNKHRKIEQAIKAYKEALRVYTFESAPENYGRTQNNLGNVFGDEAEILTDKSKIKKFEEAVNAFKEALRVYDFDSAPTYYAGIQNNLAISFKKQADIGSSKEKARKLNEAVIAYKKSLKVFTFDSMPEPYAAVQSSLGGIMIAQLEFFVKSEKKLKIKEALKCYKESLRVYTSEHYPEQYRFVINQISKLNSVI